MKMTTGMTSSNTDEWPTPQKLFDTLDATFHFTLDPCATPENAKCAKFYTKEQDGLKGLLYGAIRHTAERLANGFRNAQNTGEWLSC